MRAAPPPDELPEPPGHFAQLITSLMRSGFTETYRDERPGSLGSFMRIYERDPVRVRIIWDGRDREWVAALNARQWEHDAWGEVWITLPPTAKAPR